MNMAVEFLLEMASLSCLGYLYFIYQKKRLLYFEQLEDFITLIDSLPDLTDEELALRAELDLFLASRKKIPKKYLISCLEVPLRPEIMQTINNLLV